jgi:oligoribonuclease NrnB/cAMP/cGMP phosphodiesterase (DHH superfamily)
MTPLCIYHGNCADGFGAAWVVRRFFGADQVDFHAGFYGAEPPDVTGRDVVMVDFSFKRPVLDVMSDKAHSILILDHHKTAQEELDGLPPPPATGLAWVRTATSTLSQNARTTALFDMSRSGAGLAWDYFFPDQKRPALIDTIEDRDLWRFALPHTREVQASVFSYPYDFRTWDFLMARGKDHMGIQDMAQEGSAIERKHHKDIAELVEASKRRMVIGGLDVPVANLPYTLSSDAGHLMSAGEPFSACYMDTPRGRIFSLRSSDAGADVSEIAKRYGGGGHRNAAGFQAPIGWEGDPS